MNIVMKPVVKMTLDARGTKGHKIAEFVEEFFNMDDTIVFVDHGVVPYSNIIFMGNSILHYAKRANRKVSYHRIKGNDREIIVFKG